MMMKHRNRQSKRKPIALSGRQERKVNRSDTDLGVCDFEDSKTLQNRGTPHRRLPVTTKERLHAVCLAVDTSS